MSTPDEPTPPPPLDITHDDWFALRDRVPTEAEPRSRGTDEIPPSLGDDFVDGWFI